MSSNSLNVDQRIVQMEFDNAQFEQGVGTSLKSLDKLKNSLDFAGQKNSIDGLSKSMKSFNASPLVASLSAARSGFSALEVAGITVISNLTTRIMAMGERLVSAVTVDPVKSGWVEYEQKMDSIKTILNSAKDKNGAAVSLEQVKKKIEELNVYADKTIYSFSDMTRNIGKFTNAGVDLDTATAAIQGVANAAAAAGADSNAASRAMYNFAQSLSVGYMQRIDWKSIENANMATVEFKDELLKTALAMGTVKKTSDGMYMSLKEAAKKNAEGSEAAAMFTEKLKDKWLTNDVLIATLNRYSDVNTEIGKKAQEAATKVFTLSKMFDTLKEAMQSGWSATWEKIVGDYDQAGKLFTGINDYLSGIIDKSANKRVKFLDELLNQKKALDKEDWRFFKAGKDKDELTAYKKALKKAAKDSGIEIDKITKKYKNFSDSLQAGWLTNDVFKKAQNGIKDFKKELSDKKSTLKLADPKIWKELDTLGSKQKQIWNLSQSLTKLGNSINDVGKKSVTPKDWKVFASKKNKKSIDAFKKALTQAAKDSGINIDKMITKNKTFEDSLKKGWLTQDVFDKARKNLSKYSKEVDKNIDKNKKLIDPKVWKQLEGIETEQHDVSLLSKALKELGQTTEKTGRDLLIESFKSVFEQITRVYENIKRAYEAVFPKASASQLREFIERIHDFTQNFEISINTIYRVRDAFKGFFSIIKLVIDIGKTGIGLIVGILKRLKPLGKFVLDVASGLGRMADTFRKNYEKGGKFKEIIDVTLESMDKLFQKVKELTQGKAITKDNWLSFTDGLDKKDTALYEKVIKRIAKEHGVEIDKMIDKNHSFEDSLKEGWFTKGMFNEVNYYLDNISAKKRKGPAIYTKEEYNRLKDLRKSLKDANSEWSKLGESAGQTAAEKVLGIAEKITKPFDNVFDIIIQNIPKVVGGLGKIATFLGGRIFGTAKIIWKIATYIYNAISGISDETKGSIQTNLGKIKTFIVNIFKSGKNIVKNFVDKVAAKLPEIKTNFKKIWEHVKKLKDALKKAYDSIKKFVKKAGELMDIKKVVKAVAGFFTALAGLTFGAVIFVIGAITEFFKYVSSNKTVNKVFSAIGDALIKMFQGLEKAAGKVKTFVTELFKLEGVKTAMDNVKQFFEGLGEFAFEKASSGFKTIGDIFKIIGDKLPSMETVLKTINGLLDGTVDKFKTIKDIFSKGIEIVTGIFKPKVDTEDLDEVEDNANDQKKSLEKSGDTLKTALGNFTKDIEDGLDNLSSAKILKTGALLGLVYIIWQIGQTIKSFKTISKNISKITSLSARNPIAKFVTGLTDALYTWRKKANAEIVLTLAKAIGILAISIVALTKVGDSANFEKATGAVFWITIAMAVLIRQLGKAFGAKSGIETTLQTVAGNLTLIANQIKLIAATALRMVSIGLLVALAAAGVAIIVGAFAKLYSVFTQEKINWGALIGSIVGILAILGVFYLGVRSLAKMDGDMPKGAAITVLAFAVAVNMMAGTLVKLANMTGDFYQGLSGVFIILLSLTGAMIALKKWAASNKTDALLDIGAGLILFAVAVRIVAGAIMKMAEAADDQSKLETGLWGIAGIMIIMAGAMGLLGSKVGDKSVDMIKIAASMVIFAAAVAILVKAVGPLAELKAPQFKQLAIGVVALVGAMLLFGLLGTALPGLAVAAKFLASIGILAAGVGAGVYLIVSAIDMLGPALDHLIDGFISFSKKIQENGPVLVAGIAGLIGIICTAMLAKTALLEKTAFSMLLTGLNGLSDALMAFLPKGKLLIGIGIVALVFTLLGALEKVMPGAIDKILGLIVDAMYSLASAIVNHSRGLVGGLYAIGEAILILAEELLQQLAEGINQSIKDRFGIDLSEIFGGGVHLARSDFEERKKNLLERLKIKKEEAEPIIENNKDMMDDITESTLPEGGAVPVPGVGALNPETATSTAPTAVTGQTKEEAYQENKEIALSGAEGYADGSEEGIEKSGLDDKMQSAILGKLKGITDENGNIDITALSNVDFSDIGMPELDMTALLDSATDGSVKFDDIMNAMLNPEKGKEQATEYSDSVNENMNLEGTREELEKTQESYNEVKEEVSKDGKVTTKQDFTISANVDTKSADKSMVAAAKGMMAKYGDAIKKQKEPIKKKVENVMEGAAHAAGSEKIKADFHESGSNAIQGLIDGINAKLPTLRAKALEAARLIKKTITSKPALDENSPSKAMFRIGDYAMVGLVNGFSNRMGALESSALDAAHSISDGTSYALARTSAMLTDGIDSTPTIRPVLDLSDVEAGARSINGMLSGRTLSVGSINASRLATSMNARQNGSDPLISAINDLGRSLSAQPSNVYNVNGITYDDGSNVANAVGMLVRAAIVEGRA